MRSSAQNASRLKKTLLQESNETQQLGGTSDFLRLSLGARPGREISAVLPAAQLIGEREERAEPFCFGVIGQTAPPHTGRKQSPDGNLCVQVDFMLFWPRTHSYTHCSSVISSVRREHYCFYFVFACLFLVLIILVSGKANLFLLLHALPRLIMEGAAREKVSFGEQTHTQRLSVSCSLA